MLVPLGADRHKGVAKLLTEARCVVTDDGQAAATFGAIQCERGDDGVTSNLQGSLKARDIGGAVMLLGEEMERRPIMPNVIRL